MTPLQIEILLHHHYSPLPWQRQSSASDDYIMQFMAEGFLRRTAEVNAYGNEWALTDRGICYVQALLDMPLPVEVKTWRMP